MNIQKFTIKKLYGTRNIELSFKDNMLILVGENGAGKTTVLRLMFYFVSGQWDELRIYNFDSISISILDKDKVEVIEVNRNSLTYGLPETLDKLVCSVPRDAQKEFYKRLEDVNGNYNHPRVYRWLEKYDLLNDVDLSEDINGKFELRKNEENDFKTAFEQLKKLIDFQILYLPTYRRIETEFNNIFNKDDDDDDFIRFKYRGRKENKDESYTKKGANNSHIELIEFGMNDVKNSIDNTLKDLKEFSREQLNNLTLRYLSDVVEKKYNEIDVSQIISTSEDSIKKVLNRIDNNILSDENKKHLFKIIFEIQKRKASVNDEHSKVICHYFLKLLKFQKDLEKKEENIKQFCEICNKYLDPEKMLDYDPSGFTFKILKKSDNSEIELKNLSSGEKQIVSIFSHLCLSNDKKEFFILIDEPELSLSVKWQKEFLLNIKNLNLFSGMIAVTHSPFIYDNELADYAKGLNMCISEVN
jgi:ABC-type Mn2+/Zn2+ transport system ATPase subunit